MDRVEACSADVDYLKAMMTQKLLGRPPREQPQVPNNLRSGPPKHTFEADLGEGWLHAEHQAQAVEPGCEIRRGQEQPTIWTEDPADLSR